MDLIGMYVCNVKMYTLMQFCMKGSVITSLLIEFPPAMWYAQGRLRLDGAGELSLNWTPAQEEKWVAQRRVSLEGTVIQWVLVSR